LRLAEMKLRLGDLDAQERVLAEIERGLAALLALFSLVALGGGGQTLWRLHLAEIERDDGSRPNVAVELHDGIESELAAVVLPGAGAREIAPERAIEVVCHAVLEVVG